MIEIHADLTPLSSTTNVDRYDIQYHEHINEREFHDALPIGDCLTIGTILSFENVRKAINELPARLSNTQLKRNIHRFTEDLNEHYDLAKYVGKPEPKPEPPRSNNVALTASLTQCAIALGNNYDVMGWFMNEVCGRIRGDDVRKMLKALGDRSSLITSQRHLVYKNLDDMAEAMDAFYLRPSKATSATAWFGIDIQEPPLVKLGIEPNWQSHNPLNGDYEIKPQTLEDELKAAYALIASVENSNPNTFNISEYNMSAKTQISVEVSTAAFAKYSGATVYGKDVSKMDEQQLFTTITRVKADIKALEDLDVDSTTVKGKIKNLNEAIENIVAVIDSKKED